MVKVMDNVSVLQPAVPNSPFAARARRDTPSQPVPQWDPFIFFVGLALLSAPSALPCSSLINFSIKAI